VKALRGEGYDVVEVTETVGLGTADDSILEYAVEQRRVIVSEDTDFRGADSTLDLDKHPGVLACDTAAPGAVVTAVRRIDESTEDLTNSILFVPGGWIRSGYD
jgi:predicted nuclease of predicted toxin-antitoxin system